MKEGIKMDYPKYVKVNDNDFMLALKEGMKPMMIWYDKDHHYLPYWGLYILKDRYEAMHHFSFSAVHVMGRFLEALVNASEITGDSVPQEIYDNLRYWAFKVFDNEMKMPANIDMKTYEPVMVCDLHNIREAMYAFLALIKLNPNDQEAKDMALHLVRTVNRYTDFETGEWKEKLFFEERHGKVNCGCCDSHEIFRFSSTMGRYIGALVRLYRIWPNSEVLEQAIRLKDTCFKVHLREDGSFDGETFAEHVHSTTSTLSGIAMLGDLLKDESILKRVKAFLDNGYYDIALKDIGWSTEHHLRNDLTGETNNACELMEACICLGKAGFSEYYARAEKALRCHILPMQLLDTSFLPNDPSDDPVMDHFASKMVGAYGTPCPYGHEYEPDTECNYGYNLCYNWDNLGGAVSGLCWAYHHNVTYFENIASINLLFEQKDNNMHFVSPYQNDGVAEIKLKKEMDVRIRLSELTDYKALHQDLDKHQINHYIDQNWLYLFGLKVGETVRIAMNYICETREYDYKKHHFVFRFEGDHVISAESKGKRLCFFAEL